MNGDVLGTIIGLAGIIVLLVVSSWSMSESHRRLDDPADDRTVYIDELAGISRLPEKGVYRLSLLRQSGNIHAEYLVTGTADDAIAKAVSTFRRAKIEGVHIRENDGSRLVVWRLYHDHRGQAEGRKVGGATIQVVETH